MNRAKLHDDGAYRSPPTLAEKLAIATIVVLGSGVAVVFGLAMTGRLY